MKYVQYREVKCRRPLFGYFSTLMSVPKQLMVPENRFLSIFPLVLSFFTLWDYYAILRDFSLLDVFGDKHYLFAVLGIGLPFSDKKLFRGIRNKTEQTPVPLEFCLFRRREKPRNFNLNHFPEVKKPRNFFPSQFSEDKNPRNSIPNHFLEEKNSRNSIPNHFSEEKNPQNSVPTVFGWEKPRKSVLNHFRKGKSLGIPFRIILGGEKTSEFLSK